MINLAKTTGYTRLVEDTGILMTGTEKYPIVGNAISDYSCRQSTKLDYLYNTTNNRIGGVKCVI